MRKVSRSSNSVPKPGTRKGAHASGTRRCIACGKFGQKSEFLRIVKTPDGKTEPDPNGKTPGRGAYVCDTQECIGNAVKKGRISGSFKSAVPSELYEKLRNKE